MKSYIYYMLLWSHDIILIDRRSRKLQWVSLHRINHGYWQSLLKSITVLHCLYKLSPQVKFIILHRIRVSLVYRLLIHVSSSVKSYTYASASTKFLKISAGNLLEDPTNSNHSNFKSRRIKFRSSSSLSLTPLPPTPQCIWPGSWKLWKYFVRNVLICLAFEMCNMVQCTR